MAKLGDLYTDFSRIDLDTRGGYARVSQAKNVGQVNLPEYCAFKVMRHDLSSRQKGIDRFESEIRTLLDLTQDKNCPSAITKIYDAGFVSIKLSRIIQKPLNMVENIDHIEKIDPELEIISVGVDLIAFMNLRTVLETKQSERWLPYISVELAPYKDNLLRQIRFLSGGNISDLYGLPVREIISMGLQILEVIDYLHQRHNIVYRDWKTEHIFWNSLKPQLKIIDWNVTDRFINDREKKLLIREDIRMLCGAALYSAFALNDPEDLKRPIGPKPKIAPDPVLSSQSRYWTDQPIFYDRDVLLDKRIKLLIKDALDPKKGFDSPQELRSELLEYGEQVLGLSAVDLSPLAISRQKKTEIQALLDEADEASAKSEYHRSIQLYRRALGIDPNNERAKAHLDQAKSELAVVDDTEGGLPHEAMQIFRAARSYIAGGDYQDAIRALEDAIEIAFKKGVIFREAQQLLDKVKISLEVERVKQNIDNSLRSGNRDLALELYKKAISLYPENTALLDEFTSLQNLIQTESDLRIHRFRNFFSSLARYQTQLENAKNILNLDNPILQSTEQVIKEIRFVQLRLSSLLALILIFTFLLWNEGVSHLFSPINTPVATTIIAASATSIDTITPIPATATPSLVITATITSTPTPVLVTLGNGYISWGQVSTWDKPNGKFIMFVTHHQVVTILEKIEDHNESWYRCSWEVDSNLIEGWILAKYVQIGQLPTPRP